MLCSGPAKHSREREHAGWRHHRKQIGQFERRFPNQSAVRKICERSELPRGCDNQWCDQQLGCFPGEIAFWRGRAVVSVNRIVATALCRRAVSKTGAPTERGGYNVTF